MAYVVCQLGKTPSVSLQRNRRALMSRLQPVQVTAHILIEPDPTSRRSSHDLLV
jgi:hypothetical protein